MKEPGHMPPNGICSKSALLWRHHLDVLARTQSSHHYSRLKLLEWGTLGAVNMIISGSLPLLAPCRATRFRPEVPLVGGWALPEQSHPCKTEGGRPASVDHTPARTGPLPILSKLLRPIVWCTSQNCLWVSGQCVPRTQAARGRSGAWLRPAARPSPVSIKNPVGCWVGTDRIVLTVKYL